MENTAITIGRTLNIDGKPLEDTGVVLQKDSVTAKLLLANHTVVLANPITKEYGALIEVRDDQNQIVKKGLGIIPPNASGPPKHIHPHYDEIFTVVEGAFDFFMDNKMVRINQGETVIVKKGIAHSFKPAQKNTVCSFLVQADPPGKLNEVIRTVWGLALDGKTNKKGQPNEFWQGIAIGKELKDDTLFVSPPPFIQKLMFSIFGKIASEKGYKGIYEKYSSDDFWIKRIEQIPLIH